MESKLLWQALVVKRAKNRHFNTRKLSSASDSKRSRDDVAFEA
jgi:hypothetical protein